MVVASHLWASMMIDCARSIPDSRPRKRSEASADPPRRIDVVPKPLARGDVAHAAEDRSCRRRCTGGGHDHHRNGARRTIFGDGARERRGIHSPAAVGVDEPQRGASHAGLVGDFQPRNVAFARGVEARRARQRAGTLARETRVGGGQCADERRIVRLDPPWRNARWRSRPCAARRATARMV